MAPPHKRRLKAIEFELDGNRHECQITNWLLDRGEQDGDRGFTFCTVEPEYTEETDAEPTLQVTWLADWRAGGLSDFLWVNSGKVVPARILHHPGTVGETVRFEGSVRLKSPPVGGESRATETNEVTMQVTNLTYARV